MASGTGGTSFGTNGMATGSASAVLGNGSVASGSNEVAFGEGGLGGDGSDTVSVGSAGNERRIRTVATGVNGADAVNVNQLDAGLGSLQNQISSNLNAAYAGTAAATAAAGLRHDDRPGKISAAAARATIRLFLHIPD